MLENLVMLFSDKSLEYEEISVNMDTRIVEYINIMATFDRCELCILTLYNLESIV
jgi:hypothetical protein